jgi:predicted membrane metal-binding protein
MSDRGCPLSTALSWPQCGQLCRSQRGVRRRALAALPAKRAGLLTDMGQGDTSLPPYFDRAFRAAGLTHLMAVSGSSEQFGV